MKLPLLTAALLLTAGTACAAPDPLAIPGVELGMTLEAFRTVPYGGKKGVSATLRCSSDKDIAETKLDKIRGDFRMTRRGQVFCGYTIGNAMAPMTAKDIQYTSAVFAFVLDDQENLRLYAVTLDAKKDWWWDIKKKFPARFGRAEPFQFTVQDAAGRDRDSQLLQFSTGTATIWAYEMANDNPDAVRVIVSSNSLEPLAMQSLGRK